jgi:hypothetical protein
LQDAVVGAGEEHGVPQPGVGDLVAVSVRDALDETVLAQPPQVVGGLAGGGRAWWLAEEFAEQRAARAAGWRRRPGG